MKLQTLSVALVALILGTTTVPVEAMADPPSWAPAHGWRKQKNVDKREQRVETREERAEKRELRALRLRDPDATARDLNRSQVTKLERQNRREAEAARLRRETSQNRREAELARLQRENRLLREQRAFGR